MKILALIARLLLGLVFTVFGLNGFIHFMPMPPNLPDNVVHFITPIATTGYGFVVFGCQVIGGVLLLVGKYVPLGLVFLGPVLVNILCFHFFISHGDYAIPLFVTVLWFIVFARYRYAFRPLFQP